MQCSPVKFRVCGRRMNGVGSRGQTAQEWDQSRQKTRSSDERITRRMGGEEEGVWGGGGE